MENSDQWIWLSAKQLGLEKEWWDIYQDSFPSSERDSVADLLNATEKQLTKVGMYVIQKKIAAILVCYEIGNPSFIFLNFIAVAKSMHCKGLGFKFFSAFIDQVKLRINLFTGQNYAVIWEVEDPDKAINSSDKILRERRIKFYDKAGTKFLNKHFIQPAVDGSNSVPMRLMYYLFNTKYDIHTMEEKIIRAIYFKKYQRINKISTEVIEQFYHAIFS